MKQKYLKFLLAVIYVMAVGSVMANIPPDWDYQYVYDENHDLSFGCYRIGESNTCILKSYPNGRYSGHLNLPGSVKFPTYETEIIDGQSYEKFKEYIDLIVVEIGSFSFQEELTGVTIPNTVTRIDEAFGYCNNLMNINLPISLLEIGEGAFQGCKNLRQISIPSSVLTIGKCAFMSCESLRSITIPVSVSVIESLAFHGCKGLESVIFNGCPSEIAEGSTFYTGRFASDATKLAYPSNWTLIPFQKRQGGYNYGEWYGGYFTKVDYITQAMVPIVENTKVDFSQSMNDETNLNGIVDGSIYYSLKNEQGDGYNSEEGCLLLNSTMSDDLIAETCGGIAWGESGESTGGVAQGGIPETFSGLIAYQGGGETCGSVAWGESGETTGGVAYGEAGESVGSIALNYQTLGNMQLCVKIGNNEPLRFTSPEQTIASVPFRLKDDAPIIVYAQQNGTTAASKRAAATENCLKLYSIQFTIDEVASTGVEAVRGAIDNTMPTKWYSSDGHQLTAPARGVNIVRMSDGTTKKILVK